MCNIELSNLVRRKRLELNYSVEYTSELVGAPIDKIESGSFNLDCSHLSRISKILSLDVDNLYRLNFS